MADARDRFTDAAAGLGIDIDVVTYPEGTRTAQDAADAIGCRVGQIVKSLVFVGVGVGDGGERPVLALTSGARMVDTAALATLLGVDRVRKASADEVRETTGFAIGGTPPFGHAQPLETLLDPHLAAFDEVWAAAGTPTAVFRLTPDDLRRAGAKEPGDFTAPPS